MQHCIESSSVTVYEGYSQRVLILTSTNLYQSLFKVDSIVEWSLPRKLAVSSTFATAARLIKAGFNELFTQIAVHLLLTRLEINSVISGVASGETNNLQNPNDEGKKYSQRSWRNSTGDSRLFRRDKQGKS